LLGPNIEVTDSDAGFNVSYADVTADGDTVYAVWLDDRDSYDEQDVFFSKSVDGGATWNSNVSVSNGFENEIGLDAPAVAMYPDGWVHVVWFNPYPTPDGDCPGETCVYMAASEDGTSFEAWKLWSSNDESYYIEPQIAIDPDSRDMVVAVSDYVGSGAGGENIYGLVWDYAAQDWRSQVINDQSGSADSSAGVLDGSRMAVAARDGTATIAWEDARDGGMRIYGDCTTDHGQNWGTDFSISPEGADATRPHLALTTDGTLYAAYEITGEIYLRSSGDQGASWSTATQVSYVSAFDDAFVELGRWDMAIDGNGTVAVIWAAGDWGTFGSSHLYLSTSIDGGHTFTHEQVDDAGDIYNQYSPAIAAIGSGENAYAVMVWEDNRNTHDEIWSARAVLDATPPTAPCNLQASPGDTVVDLTWDTASDASGIKGYYVVRAATSGGPYSVLNSHILTQTLYRDVGLGDDTVYYRVYALDTTGNVGPASNEVSATAVVGTDMPVTGTLAYEVDQGRPLPDVRLNDLPNLDNERTLVQGNFPRFSQNGQRVYYSSHNAITSCTTIGGDPQTYYRDPDFHGAFDIARDNGALASQSDYFAWIKEDQETQFGDYFEQWKVWEPSYGTVVSSTQYVDQYEFGDSPSISAGRRWLAYTSLGYHRPNINQGSPSILHMYDHAALFVVDLDSENRAKTIRQETHYMDPAFAPQGGSLAFAAMFTDQYEIWKATVGISGTLRNLTQLTRGASGEWSLAPAWSSDGQWLVFMRGMPGGDADPEGPELQNPQLYIVRHDGSSLRTLGIAGEEPAWYGTTAATPTCQVSITPTQGTNGTPFTIMGAHFTASVVVTLTVDDAFVQSVGVNSRGAFTTTYTPTDLDVGEHTLAADDGDRRGQTTLRIKAYPLYLPLVMRQY
jgi:hypothetical protein